MARDDAGQQPTPFHAGERYLQRQAGAAEKMDAIGRRVIRDHMPDQHREFFAQLPFLLIGAVDPAGDAWATLATGDPGFMKSPDAKTLQVYVTRDEADPANTGLDDGAGVGLLGIELHTRRRNRVNGRLRRSGAGGFVVTVEHSFGNCPKYIQLRDFHVAEDTRAAPPPAPAVAVALDRLSARAREIIGSADTFFVASYADRDGRTRQVDVSHRGGKPGFVRVDERDRLSIPDFAGNQLFNTLGNIWLNGKAGLLFVDFDTGDVLQLTGDAHVVLDSPEVDAFAGSERIWTFGPRRIVYRAAASRLRWRGRADGLSPFLRATGSWRQTRTPEETN